MCNRENSKQPCVTIGCVNNPKPSDLDSPQSTYSPISGLPQKGSALNDRSACLMSRFSSGGKWRMSSAMGGGISGDIPPLSFAPFYRNERFAEKGVRRIPLAVAWHWARSRQSPSSSRRDPGVIEFARRSGKTWGKILNLDNSVFCWHHAATKRLNRIDLLTVSGLGSWPKKF